MLPAAPLGQNGVGEGARRHLAADRDGEIAVAASSGAEGNMDVEVHPGICTLPGDGRALTAAEPPARPLLDDALELQPAEQRQQDADGFACPRREEIEWHGLATDQRRH